MKNNKGYSLVEIITVVTIISILSAVLVPTLLHHIEKSRAGRDLSAMSEVANAVRLSISNQDIYDELTDVSTTNNISCYIDEDNENKYEKIITKKDPNGVVEQYTYGDYARQADEKAYYVAGKMRGVTITFVVNDQSHEDPYVVDISKAIINKYTDDPRPITDYTWLCSNIKQIMGNEVVLKSHTYRASEYTVFVKIGTFGGREADKQDAVQVYGQFGGTSLNDESVHERASSDPLQD